MSWHSLHFNKIAKVIRDKRGNKDAPKSMKSTVNYQAREQLLNELTLEFTEYFRDQNPSFNATDFIYACGYYGRKDES